MDRKLVVLFLSMCVVTLGIGKIFLNSSTARIHITDVAGQSMDGVYSSERSNLTSLIVDGTTVDLGGRHEFDLVEVKNGGILRVDSSQGWLNITARTITIDSTSKIDGNGNGNNGGTGFHSTKYGPTQGCGTAGSGQSPGGGSCGGNPTPGAGGGGYGGAGESGGYSGGPSGTHGTSNLRTVKMGSGGGGAGSIAGNPGFYDCDNYGGNGGRSGAVVVIRARDVNVLGQITVNGNNGGNSLCTSSHYLVKFGAAGGGGGGSGGGLLIEAEYLNVSSATLEAKGGKGGDGEGYDCPAGGGGGGGGGRIKIFYGVSLDNSSVSIDVSGGGGGGSNGGANGQSGSPGTIYYEETGAIHDIAIIQLEAASEVITGRITSITVVVKNEGFENETFNVATYYNGYTIYNLTVSDLPPVFNETLTFVWDTAGVSPGVYLLSAEADVVLGETDIDDNSYVDGNIEVKEIKIVEVISSDASGDLKNSCNRGTLAFFKVTVNNTAISSASVLITINIYDSVETTIGVASFQGPISPGVSIFIQGLPIPSSAQLGNAAIYANAFTEWPHNGGVPYCLEVPATFEIVE